ncbi:type IV pili methyl-accepting chemotaxis transducer N-terminal domain-containing protein [Aquabacterium humicola]|uniref:type IV pili methyl-accepting chemotaxis transducer N-terminal domain-containing protein n=1 Tax=Aquabacterium humicola TaxID=3237377 RepID=UPI002542F608|nr:type IV pili methyl-accepting chemotaxis transducer N-terminal domain-containing protein [Rubrivivax pictus]
MVSARWPLASKLFVTGCALLAAALASIGLTLWVSWQLEGGAAAVNEAGRMRMQTYRFVLLLQAPEPAAARLEAAEAMDASLELLRSGDPARPLMVPWNDDTRARFDELRRRWTVLRAQWLAAPGAGAAAPALAEVDNFVQRIDGFVGDIEQQLSQRTAVLRGVQFALVALAIGATVASFYIGHLFVLEPLQRLKRAVARFGEHDFAARVEQPSADEFGDVGQAFNAMAAHLQALYAQLEAKVEEKTARLEIKRRRLAALYEVSAFIARADALQPLAEGFAPLLRRIAQADAVVVRWSDEDNQRYLMLASEGLPDAIAAGEQCLPTGGCHCGQPAHGAKSRVIPIAPADVPAGSKDALRCGAHGFRTLLSVPVRLHARVLGEIDLLFREPRAFAGEERSLYDTLASHLAARIEALRAAELQREAAVAGERSLLAQELHDSIAQSLAFLKIQVALLKKGWRQNDAATVERSLGELESGVQESYADVRELLLHFRTRTRSEDIVSALRQTLSKFELQAHVPAQLHSVGHGVPLPADVQIQVLHIVQEALSNVRKHAHASAVSVHVQQAPVWRFEVRDDGCGFDADALRPATHVGLAIMRERAERIGATLQWRSGTGGTCVVLTLPAPATSPLAEDIDGPSPPARLADQAAGR